MKRTSKYLIAAFLGLAVLFGATPRDAAAAVTYVWTQSAPSASVRTSSGTLVISDAAFAAGNAHGVGCGMSCGPDLSNQLLSFTFSVNSATINIVPPVSSALYNYSLTPLANGLLTGSIYAENYTEVVRMSDVSAVWALGFFTSDNPSSGCFFSSCGGAKGYWLDTRFPAPASAPGTLALLILPLLALVSQRPTKRERG